MHDAVIRNPSSSSLRAHYTHVRGEAQHSIRVMKNKWWQEKAAEIESFADRKDTRSFYAAIKQVYGPVHNSYNPIRSADWTKLHKDRQDIVSRWGEHFGELLNRVNQVDPPIVEQLPCLPQIPSLDEIPSFSEVHRTVKRLKNNKAAGPDSIPGEIFK